MNTKFHTKLALVNGFSIGVCVCCVIRLMLMGTPTQAAPPDYESGTGGATAPGYKLVTPTVGTTYAASRGFMLDDTAAGSLVYLDGEGTSQTLAHLNVGQIYALRVTKVVSYGGTAGAVRLVY